MLTFSLILVKGLLLPSSEQYMQLHVDYSYAVLPRWIK